MDNTRTPKEINAISEEVYNALVIAIQTPVDDKFQVITKHTKEELIFNTTYLRINRSDHFVLIQIFLYPGRTVEQKKLLYKPMAEKLANNPGVRREDVWINLVKVPKENWSYGMGEAQFANE